MGKMKLGDILPYEQPNKYIVKTTKYSDSYNMAVLTAGKTFVLGYTDETEGIYDNLPCIIFDDFTTTTKYVNFPFKVKSSAMKILTAVDNSINLKYFFYLMQTIRFNAQTHKRFWISEYSKIEVDVPDLPTQEKTVEKIEELFSELDKGIEELTTAKAKLKVYRQAVLKEAFEGKWYYSKRVNPSKEITSVTLPSSTELPQLPEKWVYVSLEQLGDLGRGKSKHRPRNDNRLFENGSYPFLQTSEVKKARKFITEYTKMYGEFGLAQSKLWNKGTLCITIAANIAETAFLGMDACFPDSVVGFSPNKELVIAEYIKYFIESAKIRLWAFAPATAQKNINLSTLENLIVPYCALGEQHFIVSEIESRLSICDNIEATIEESLIKAERLRQSILKEAFEGNLV